MSKNILFITVNTIKERTGLHNNLDEKLVKPEILVCQDMYIEPALGTALYNYLQDAITNNTKTSDDIKLIDEYITPCLVWYVMSSLTKSLSYQFYNKGLIRKAGDGQENPSMQDILDIESINMNKAEFYKQKLINYLMQISSQGEYPQYLNAGSGYDTVLPEKNAYTTTIWLGDDDCCSGKTFEEKYQGNLNRCCGK